MERINDDSVHTASKLVRRDTTTLPPQHKVTCCVCTNTAVYYQVNWDCSQHCRDLNFTTLHQFDASPECSPADAARLEDGMYDCLEECKERYSKCSDPAACPARSSDNTTSNTSTNER